VRTTCIAAVILSMGVVAAGAQPPQDDAPKPPETRMDWNPRPSLRIGDVARIDFRVKLQLDFRSFSPEQPKHDDTFRFHRRRAAIEGTLFRRVDFQVERELREDGPWRDVYADARLTRALQVQGGKFKIPFGLEETTGSTDLDFIYRTVGTNALTPARDQGVMLHGRLGRVDYEAGGFRHDGEDAITEESFLFPGERGARAGAAIAGRAVVAPWGRGGGSRPRIGVAFTQSRVPEGLNGITGRSVFASTFFSQVYVRGRRVRFGAQAEWNPGPFGFKSEYLRVEEQRHGQSLQDSDLSALIGQSWYASATALLVGRRNRQGLEIAGRIEHVWFRSASQEGPAFSNPRADHLLVNGEYVWTAGAAWYMTRWTKIQVNAIREVFSDPRRTPLLGHTSFVSAVMRLQMVL
jgi:phosphate-selective porin